MYSKRSKKLNQKGGKDKKKSSKKRTNLWAEAFKQARKKLNIKGFQPLKKGTPLYDTTKSIHNQLKSQNNK